MSSPLHAHPLRIGASAVAALLVAACAAATPGYKPPDSKPTLLSRAKPFESGDVSAGGVYEPSAQEKALDCRKITGSIHIMIERIKDAPNRIRPSATAATMQSMAKSTIGGTVAGSDIDGETTRERARLEAYNKLLAEKKCPTLDIAAELGAPKKK